MRAALAVGTPNPELVAVEARRAATYQAVGNAAARTTTGDDVASDEPARIVSLPDRPDTAAALPQDRRPLPSVTPYDQLLRRRDPHPASTDPAAEQPEPGEAV